VVEGKGQRAISGNYGLERLDHCILWLWIKRHAIDDSRDGFFFSLSFEIQFRKFNTLFAF